MAKRRKQSGRVVALLLSGGTGARVGSDVPKQYIEVGGRPVISYCIERLFSHDRVDAVQIVADPLWHGRIRDCLAAGGFAEDFQDPARTGSFQS